MQTSSADYFTGLRDSLTGLGVDYARSRLIDVERMDDDRNAPDRIDAADWRTVGGSGVSMLTVGMIAVAVVVGVVLLKRVL